MDVLEWLLEPNDPSVRYRTLVELLDQGGTAEAQEAKEAIAGSEAVKKLMALMHPGGYWLQPDYKG